MNKGKQVIPRIKGDIYDCQECGWQGRFIQTNSGCCPDCGAEVEKYNGEESNE